MRITTRRRLLIVVAAILALADLWLVLNHGLHRESRDGLIHFQFDHPFMATENLRDSTHRVTINWHQHSWYGVDGKAIKSPLPYTTEVSNQIIRNLTNAYPPVDKLPVFVSLGPNANFGDFLAASHSLVKNQICWVGFDELSHPVRMADGNKTKETMTFKIC